MAEVRRLFTLHDYMIMSRKRADHEREKLGKKMYCATPGCRNKKYDALPFCSSCVPRVTKKALESGLQKGFCWVYFIQAIDGGPVKIGRAQDVTARLSELQTASAKKLHVVAKVVGPTELEKKFHKMLKEHRIRGEWFQPSGGVAVLIKIIRSGEFDRIMHQIMDGDNSVLTSEKRYDII